MHNSAQYRSGLEKHSRLLYILVFCEPELLEIPVRQILILLAVFLLSFPVLVQSEESIQFETFYQEDET